MFENRSPKDVLAELSVDPSLGLDGKEIERRRALYGENKLQEGKKKGPLAIFLGEFKDPMVIVLFVAALISMIVGIVQKDYEQFIDVGIIMAVVVINAIIGTIMETKAEKALEALKKLSSPTATVRREGKIVEVKASELVPGDIVILEEGRTVPADLRLLKSFSMKSDESSLTGESLPVEKDADLVLTEEVGPGDRLNVCYMSTPIVYGRGEGVVIATGMNTEIGRIASSLDEGGEEQTPLQKQLAKLSKFLGILAAGVVALMLIVSLLYSAFLTQDIETAWIGDLMDSVSLAVAAIPEGLPAVVTIVLALGMSKMVKVNTNVRRLASVETLGAVSVICSDKTGTLTENKMTVVGAYLPGKLYRGDELSGDSLVTLAKGMCLCSDASIEKGVYGDPTEVALVRFADSLGMKKSDLERFEPRVDELPFDSVRKMMSTMNEGEGGRKLYTKGAIDQILVRCTRILEGGASRPITEEDVRLAQEASASMSADALRVLALAIGEKGEVKEENLTFVGLVGMVDPPREAAKPAVLRLRHAGITTIMITGDHRDTAFAIARELDIASAPDQCMTGAEIDACTPEELQERVEHVRVFARVSPENKVAIVKAIKANGRIVAMTGDGVNDAPSLKQADIGIAMGITGTDVAKGAADMVLTDDNFASIEKAVEEGRGIYANIRKTIFFLLSCNIGEVLAMFVSVLIGFPAPLVAVHLLWVNLITDSLPAVALGADKKPEGIMDEQPRDPKENVFARGGYLTVFGYGLVIALATIIAFLIPALSNGAFTHSEIVSYFAVVDEATGIQLNLEESQSMAFCVLSISQLFHMLGMTDPGHSVVRVLRDKNWLLWGAFFVGMALQFLVIETPGLNNFFSVYTLSDHPLDYLYVFLLALTPLVAHELYVLYRTIHKRVVAR